MKLYDWFTGADGKRFSRQKNLRKLLNLSYTNWTNRTYAVGEMDLPEIICQTEICPDYLALYSRLKEYRQTSRTAICFYQYDNGFNGYEGLFAAIYYDRKDLLENFKKRFQDAHFFIMPDDSVGGNIHRIENEYRLFRSRVVALWLIHECNAVVVPNISFPTERSFSFALNGLERCSVVAFSTKGHITKQKERDYLKRSVKYAVDHLPLLQRIIVYDVCRDNHHVDELFQYASEHGIEIVVPDNCLKCRNRTRYEERHHERA